MDTRLQFRPIQADVGDKLAQRGRRPGVCRNNTGPAPERRSTISSMVPSNITSAGFQNSRMRNLSGGSNGSTASGSSTGSSINLDNMYSDNPIYFSVDVSPFANNSTVPQSRGSCSHRKLDRSLSDSESDRLGNGQSPSSSSSHRSVNSSRYKTELCRPFEESGSCKYGDKCQFAHGYQELRNLARHPKYKTELCRTFHTTGFCPYGPRCHFIHEDDGKVTTEPQTKQVAAAVQSSVRAGSSYTQSNTSGNSSPSLSPSGSDDCSTFSYQPESNSPRVAPTVNGENRHFNPLTVNINYGSSNNNNNSDVRSLRQQFDSALHLSVNSNNDNAGKTFVGHFSGNNSKDPEHVNNKEEFDIFKGVTMFNENILDNAPKAPSMFVSPFSMQSLKLDNSPLFADTSACWQSANSERVLSQVMKPMAPCYHSPTGSMGSDGNGSDCSGSTESLASSGCREFTTGSSHSPFSQWISGF